MGMAAPWTEVVAVTTSMQYSVPVQWPVPSQIHCGAGLKGMAGATLAALLRVGRTVSQWPWSHWCEARIHNWVLSYGGPQKWCGGTWEFGQTKLMPEKHKGMWSISWFILIIGSTPLFHKGSTTQLWVKACFPAQPPAPRLSWHFAADGKACRGYLLVPSRVSKDLCPHLICWSWI